MAYNVESGSVFELRLADSSEGSTVHTPVGMPRLRSQGHGDLDDPYSTISDVLEDGAQVEV